MSDTAYLTCRVRLYNFVVVVILMSILSGFVMSSQNFNPNDSGSDDIKYIKARIEKGDDINEFNSDGFLA